MFVAHRTQALLWILSLGAYWYAHTQGSRKWHLPHLSNVVIVCGLSKLLIHASVGGPLSHKPFANYEEAWWMLAAVPAISLLPVSLTTCLQ